MQVHFSFQHGIRDSKLDKIIDSHVAKLGLLLTRFSPDLVHLHGLVEFSAANQGPLCSLNLWLPTARLHASGRGRDLPVVVRASFDHLQEQVKKHKEVLRRESDWKRRRYVRKATKAGAAKSTDRGRQQMRKYIDQVRPQLKDFISRELKFQHLRGLSGGPNPDEEEILGEVVSRTIENHEPILADSAPFHRLLAEAIQVLNTAVPESSESRPVNSAVVSGGISDPVDHYLALLPPKKRQVYVLHALEGFSLEEVGQLMGESQNSVGRTFREVSCGASGVPNANRTVQRSADTV